ncbi:peptide ABC transporter ATP-binding protein [Erwinia sp. OLTSP20]|uniref:ABC transporter ATP-binding protein n=1 Tax=unclassified Erwinia TaxID=2622719 RepID=UPI000C1A08B7|nr:MULTISPECIES: oligopeptide/dipeptide ABC transporter ATP-binding protein [unclassified Erwinia]PIJ48504.1 peptide ABC transporter ATP-binding protein [Erwinia sp. OAMSP11]PIJ66803.1 peptide ABC transporter ATP-binding protein [Erwinia sp. OLSSP12]PIJ78777.1 peptide ABC transporter ATP-binding protein [Erwinia sp. OLCASP19]PIJ80122.1 peptide ABC transporter ATP-binding protein [Erwinia sp. OLMTSP26]PIJ82191.1 peptide ABC transporter ATP-binding protein [Erwinia sp. OLMDSP33]
MTTLLDAENISVGYASKNGWVQAVAEVSLQLNAGETVGLVGESGCGKSTLGKALMRLLPASGRLRLNGDDVLTLQGKQLLPFRRQVQMMFQDPQGSLNPRQRVGTSIARPLQVAGWSKKAISARIDQLLEEVGLPAQAATRFPHEFSGGQRQRIGIARALALEPQIVICDEPVSALDVSVRAQVINLMRDIQQRSQVTYLFISHDLSVVEYIAHRVMVMYLGRIVESGPTGQVWKTPAHPYTRALLAAAPVADPRHAHSETLLEGELPSPLNPPAGCPFHTRCPFVQAVCRQQRPPLQSLTSERQVACHFHLS